MVVFEIFVRSNWERRKSLQLSRKHSVKLVYSHKEFSVTGLRYYYKIVGSYVNKFSFLRSYARIMKYNTKRFKSYGWYR